MVGDNTFRLLLRMNSAFPSNLCPAEDVDELDATAVMLSDRPILPILTRTTARTRWLKANNVHTEFLDAGIGSCWVAEQGESDGACGETEDDAIALLARNKGLVLCEETTSRTN